jgi:hypothetical protein
MYLTPHLDETGKRYLDNMPLKIDTGDKTKSMKQHFKYMDMKLKLGALYQTSFVPSLSPLTFYK